MYSSISNFAEDSKIIKKIITIDSIFRENPDRNISTVFDYTLPDCIKSVQSISIKSAEIPIESIYHVSETNHSNYFNIHSNGNTYKVEIDSGIYNKDTISIVINDFLQGITDLKTINYYIHPISQSSIFETTSPDISFEFQFIFLEELSNRYKKYDQVLGGFLGFRENTPYICSKTTPVISESPYGTSLQKYIFLNIAEFSYAWDKDESAIDIRPYPYFNNTYTMGVISLTTPMNSVYIKRNYFGRTTTLSQLRISLVDKYGIAIDLNNNDFSIILEVILLK
jgi:hypothetical protein